MLLEIDGWRFDIDVAATMEYSASEAAEHCTCAYCRNYYAAVDSVCPELRPFLAKFGLNIDAPDELMPFDGDQQMVYDAVYTVRGRILDRGIAGIRVGTFCVFPETDLQINHFMSEPCFYLSVDAMPLPWGLDEPIEDVVSPANESSFLKRMWNKLLKRQQNEAFPT